MLLVIEVFLAAFLLVIAYYKYSFQHWKKLNIPYVPPRIPWGNYPNPILRQENFGEVISQMYHKMRKKGHKYFGMYLFSQPCFVAADPKYVKLFLAKQFHNFNFRNFYYNEKDDPVSAHLISLNGEKWRKLRTKLTPTFTTGKIKMIFKIFVECGKSLEENLENHSRNGKPLNAKDMFSSFSSDVIINCAFGVEVNEEKKKEFSKHSTKALEFDLATCCVMYLGSAFPGLCRKLGLRQITKSSADFFIDVVGKTVDFREKNNYVRNDFMQLLINLKHQKESEGEEFPIGEMAAQCFIFFLAGYETSATTMAFALYEVASNPHVYDKVKAEIDRVLQKYNGEITYDAVKEMTYVGQVVYETLRLHSPAYFISRTCTKDFFYAEEKLSFKKGSAILIPIRGLHLDPEIYPDPHKFDPERFSSSNRQNLDQYAYLPFGEGPRICIGQRFAIMEIKTALIMVLRNYKFTVNSRTSVPLKTNPTSLLYDPLGGLWLNCERNTK